jgi:hypothetical protein
MYDAFDGYLTRATIERLGRWLMADEILPALSADEWRQVLNNGRLRWYDQEFEARYGIVRWHLTVGEESYEARIPANKLAAFGLFAMAEMASGVRPYDVQVLRAAADALEPTVPDVAAHLRAIAARLTALLSSTSLG